MCRPGMLPMVVQLASAAGRRSQNICSPSRTSGAFATLPRRHYRAAMRVGLISDTHLPSILKQLDDLGPEAAQFLRTVDLILHGGDIVTRSILDWCEQFAPVLAARGNHDVLEVERVADAQILTLEGWRIGMVHDLRPINASPAELSRLHFSGADLDLMIGGDTHVERLEHRDGVVIMNSGSPNLPHHRETRLG